jgi:transposase InsO family protein
MNRQDTDRYEYRKLVAQTKFALIAPVISMTYPDESISAYFRRIAMHEIEWPDGTKRKFSDGTLKTWLQRYRMEGIDGLIPKSRLDAGRVRKLNDHHKEFIHNLIKEFPRITGVMVYEKMIEEGILNIGDASVDTIQRYIRNSGIRNGRATITKERRTWEYAHSCDGYEADTCHTFYIFDENGEYRKTYLIAIIDNHSRMIVGAEFFYNDNAVNFQKVWHDAVLRYGRSKVIILDNGSSYKNKSTREIEARLGTKVIYNPPYEPTGKALIERFFHTIKMRWLDCDHGRNYHSLTDLNTKLNSWINEYNRTGHSALDKDSNDNHTPLDRYMYDMRDIEPCRLSNKSSVEYASWLEEVFLYETTRKVNGDSTVVVENISFDVPSQYIGLRVIIRYEPRRFENVYLYDVSKKIKVPLKRTDKIENGLTRRTEIIY